MIQSLTFLTTTTEKTYQKNSIHSTLVMVVETLSRIIQSKKKKKKKTQFKMFFFRIQNEIMMNVFVVVVVVSIIIRIEKKVFEHKNYR